MALLALGIALLAVGLLLVYTSIGAILGIPAIAGFTVTQLGWVLVAIGAVLSVVGFFVRPAYRTRGRRYVY